MTMSSNETTTGKLTDADLRQIYGRYVHLNGMNDYPGQMHAGFTYAMIPALKKIYADNKEKRVEAYTRHMSEYFNVTPYVGGLPLGVVLAMEEQNAQDPDFDTSTITGIKTALMGPLSAIGDTVFHATLRVIATAVVISMASAGNIAGPILFMLIFNIPQLITRWVTLKSGYRRGTKLLEQAESSGIMEKISYAASVIGLAAIGAMNSEMKSGKWVWAGIGLQLCTGYTVAYLVYTIGTLVTAPSTLNVGAAVAGLIAVLIMAAVIVCMVHRTNRKIKEDYALAGNQAAMSR